MLTLRIKTWDATQGRLQAVQKSFDTLNHLAV